MKHIKMYFGIAILLIAHSSLAEPIIINLLPNGGNEKEKISLPLEAAELSKTIKDMLADLGSVTELMRKDKKTYTVDLPIYKIDKRTLGAIANTLMAIEKLQRYKKEFSFRAIKSIVKDSSFPSKDPAKPNDILNFILAANFLDIREVLRPAAAIFVDMFAKEVPKGVLGKAVTNQLKDIPKDLRSVFDDYLAWLNNPTSLIHPVYIDVRIENHGAMAIAHNKLYVASATGISVIDLATNKLIGTHIKVKEPRAFAVAGNKLYAAIHEDNVVLTIDVATDKVIGEPIAVGRGPQGLIIADSDLYVANSSDRSVSTIDTLTNKIKGDPIMVGSAPMALAVAGNKLYVANAWDNTISVIDRIKGEIIGKPIQMGQNPSSHTLAVVGRKLYATRAEDSAVSIIDFYWDRRQTATQLRVWQGVTGVAFVENMLCYAGDAGITVIDPATDKVVGKRLEDRVEDPNKQRARRLVSSGKKLYADLNTGFYMFDFEKFFYYSK